MNVEKRILWDKKTGKDFVPVSHTEAVVTPDGETSETRNTRQMQAVKGVGDDADAGQFPFMSLGEVSDITDMNNLLDEAYNKRDAKYQGRLRIKRNGQTLWVDQTAIDYSHGYWMQVTYGPYAPAANGARLMYDSENYHICWRMKTLGQNKTWRDLAQPTALKTINGQSIIGYGNITINTAQQITIDTELSGSSDNAIANSAVTAAVGNLQTQVDGKASFKNGVFTPQTWGENAPSNPTSGNYWYKPSTETLYKYVDGEWEDVTDEFPHMIVMNPGDLSLHVFDVGSLDKVFGNDFTKLEKRTSTRFYHVEGVVKSNNLPSSNWTIVDETYHGTGGYVYIDTYGTPRPLLKVSNNLYTDWDADFGTDGKLSPEDYHFTTNDYYIYENTVSGNVGIIITYYNGIYWITSEYDDQPYVPGMYDISYNEDDMVNDDFPNGDATHQYAMYNSQIFQWDAVNSEWSQISGTDEWYPVLAKFKNKVWKLYADEKELLWDFTPDSALDSSSKNAVQNKVVKLSIDDLNDRLNSAETSIASISGAKVLPIDGVLPAGYTYIPEQVGYVGAEGELFLDVTNSRVVLAVTEDDSDEIETLYYVVWNDAGGRLPNTVYDLTDPTNIIFAWISEDKLHFGKLNGETLVEIASGNTPSITIDTALNRTSANPVQNAAVTGAINTITTSLNRHNERITQIENTTTKAINTIKVYGDDYQVYEHWAKGDLWFDPVEGELYVCITEESDPADTFEEIEPSYGVLYYMSQTHSWCVWNGGGFDELLTESFVISGSDI